MTSHPAGMPLYHQVAGVLRQRVLDGTYPPEFRLPPEDDLASEFDVSRATIRQAVGELVNAGMISRRQGRGTFVREGATSDLGQVFRGTISGLLREVRRTKIGHLELDRDMQLPGRIADALELPEGRGTIIRRVRLWDDQPFAYTINYYPERVAKQFTKAEVRSGGLMQLMERKNIHIDGARQTIRAELADVTVAAALGTALGSPVLYVERLLLGKKAVPIGFVRSWYRADLYEYTVTFERGDGELREQFA